MDWITAYVGVKEDWLTIEEANKLAFNKELGSCDEELLLSLDLSKESKSEFLNSLKNIVNEEGNTDAFQLKETKAKRKWQVGFLIDVVSTKKSIKEKLEDVESAWARLNYIKPWKPFIYYLPNSSASTYGVDNLYSKLIRFIERERSDLGI